MNALGFLLFSGDGCIKVTVNAVLGLLGKEEL